MLSLLRGRYHGTQAPRILISAGRIGEALTKLGTGPGISVTLEATVDADSPITVDPDQTLLDPNSLALYDRGLTFPKIATGEVTPRGSSSVCLSGSYATVTSELTIEIPKHGGSSAYKVTHTFRPPVVLREPQHLSSHGHELHALQQMPHGDGLEIGQIYEIGLGADLTKVPWWQWGSKWRGVLVPLLLEKLEV